MAIKQQQPLSKEDFEAALVTHRLSVSEVSRESGIPRHIVSHFRNYGDGLKPEQATKLRDYLEGLGVEFTDDETAATTHGGASPALKFPTILSDDGLTQRTALVCRHFFIDERITEDQILEAGERIRESFEEAKTMMDVELVTQWPSDGYDDSTETKLRELWGHLARIGLVSLHLQGRVLIDQSRILTAVMPEEDRPSPETLGDLMAIMYHEVISGIDDAAQVDEAAA